MTVADRCRREVARDEAVARVIADRALRFLAGEFTVARVRGHRQQPGNLTVARVIAIARAIRDEIGVYPVAGLGAGAFGERDGHFRWVCAVGILCARGVGEGQQRDDGQASRDGQNAENIGNRYTAL